MTPKDGGQGRTTFDAKAATVVVERSGICAILLLLIGLAAALAWAPASWAAQSGAGYQPPSPPAAVGFVPEDEGTSSPLQAAVEEQVRRLETEEIDRFLRTLDPEAREHLPGPSLTDYVLNPKSSLQLDPGGFLRALAERLAGEVTAQLRLLGQLVLLAALCALLHNLAPGRGGAAEFGFFVAYMVVVFLGIQSFQAAAAIGREILSAMSSFMMALLPLMATMLAAVGAVTSAAVFHPVLVTVVTFVVGTIEQVVIPVLFLSAIVGVVGQIATEFPLHRLAQLLRQGALAALSLLFTVFLGVVVVRGAIAPVADGVALRTTKFLAGAVIPVVGSMMADAMEVVVGGSLLIKNALGVFGLLTLIALLAFPLLKIFAMVIIYRIATALVQPLSDPRLVEALSVLAGTLTSLMAAVATAALMFFVVITVVIGIGNLTAIVR